MSMEPMVKGIIFDFGGVFTKTWRRRQVWRSCEAELGLAPGSIAQLLFTGQHWWDVSTGKASEEEYWRHVHSLLGGRVPTALAPFQYNPFAYEELNRSMVSLVRGLHRHYQVGLLSNATAYLDALLVDYHLMDLFDTVVNSARVGRRKPEPEIYQLTCRGLRLSPTECLFVDDKERNTQVAENMGMQALVFRSAARLKRDLQRIGVRMR
jgi:epoxide hydrolase-like predicted phosphatase